jgi:hypothetical protein
VACGSGDQCGSSPCGDAAQPIVGIVERRQRAAANPAVGQIRKVALVSHNYNVTDDRGLYDYSEYFPRINKLLPVSPGAVRPTS